MLERTSTTDGRPLRPGPAVVRLRAHGSEVGCQVAGWFWSTRKLNALADERDFKAITKRVNGGYRGLEQRERYYRRALEVLGADKGP